MSGATDPVVARNRRLEDAANQGIIVEATAADERGDTVRVRVRGASQPESNHVEFHFVRPFASPSSRAASALERHNGVMVHAVSLVHIKEAAECADEWFRERHAPSLNGSTVNAEVGS